MFRGALLQARSRHCSLGDDDIDGHWENLPKRVRGPPTSPDIGRTPGNGRWCRGDPTSTEGYGRRQRPSSRAIAIDWLLSDHAGTKSPTSPFVAAPRRGVVASRSRRRCRGRDDATPVGSSRDGARRCIDDHDVLAQPARCRDGVAVRGVRGRWQQRHTVLHRQYQYVELQPRRLRAGEFLPAVISRHAPSSGPRGRDDLRGGQTATRHPAARVHGVLRHRLRRRREPTGSQWRFLHDEQRQHQASGAKS